MPGGACSSPASAPRSELNSVPVDSVVAMARGRGRRGPPGEPGGPDDGLLQLQGRVVRAEQRVEDDLREVDLVRVEHRLDVLAVDGRVRLLRRVLVQGLPALRGALELAGRDRVEVLELALDVRV